MFSVGVLFVSCCVKVERQMKPYQIYLAHSVHERVRGRDVQNELEDLGFTVWNPFYAVFREDIQALDNGEVKPWSMTSKEHSLEIMRSDLKAVRQSDLLVSILPECRTIGIPCEMLWAWVLEVPVFSVTETLSGHPWVIGLSEKIFGCEAELYDWIVQVRKGKVKV